MSAASNVLGSSQNVAAASSEMERTVQVSGLSIDICEGDIEDIFVHLCEDGEIEQIKWNPKTLTALVTFSQESDAKAVLEKQELEYDGTILELMPPEIKEPTCVVQVEGVPTSISDKKLHLFFANPKRGGKITSVTTLNELRFVTFANREDAEKVVNTGTFQRDKEVFTVRWYEEPEEAVCLTLEISGLESDTDQCELEDMLRSHDLTHDGDKVTSFERKGKSVVASFSNASVVKRLIKQKSLIIMDNEVSFADFKPEACSPKRDVLISELPKDATRDYVELFFENGPRSGGGPLEKVEINRHLRTARIAFKDSEDARTVVSKHSFEREDGTTLIATWLPDDYVHNDETEIVRPETVVITGFTKKITQEIVEELEDLLESRTREKVSETTINNNDNSLSIKFETRKGAEKAGSMYKSGNISIQNMTLELCYPFGSNTNVKQAHLDVPHDSENNLYIEVTNIPSKTSDDHVRLYFERFGDIEDIRFDPQNGRALLSFGNEERNAEVLSKASKSKLVLNEARLSIKRFTGSIIPNFQTCAVEITGLPLDFNESLIHDLFENERETGGGRITDIFITNDNERVVVTYHDVTVAARVISHDKLQPINADGQRLTLNHLPCPDVESSPAENQEQRKLILKNISEDATVDDLLEFFQEYSHYQVIKVIYGTKIGEAIVEIDRNPDEADPWREIRMRPLKGQMISLGYVEISRSIEVFGTGALSDYKIKLYFESKRSKGGVVERIERCEETQCVVVTFENVRDAENVLENTHKIGAEEIRIKKHYACIGVLPPQHDTNEPVRSVPSNFVIEVRNENVYEYLQKTKLRDISSLAEDLNANIEWSNSKSEITVSCSISPTDRQYKHVFKSWKSDIQSLESFVQKYKEKRIQIPQQPKGIESEMHLFISDQERQCQTKDVSILVEKNTIHVIGLTSLVDDLTKMCDETIRTKSEHLQKMAERASDTLSLEPVQVGYLKSTGKLAEITQKYTELQCDTTDSNIYFDGSTQDIQNAKMEIMQFAFKLKTEKHKWIHPGVAKLLQNDGVMEYILQKCRGASINVFITIGNNQEYLLCSENSVISKQAVDAIEKEWVLVEKITVDDPNIALLSHSSFHQLLQTIETDATYGIAVVVQKSSQISLVGIHNDDIQTAAERINYFLEENSIMEEFVEIDYGCVRLLNQNSNLKNGIEKRFSAKCDVVAEDDDVAGVILKGSRRNIADAKRDILQNQSKVVTDAYKVTAPGMSQYFMTEKQHIADLEHQFEVVILPLDKNGQHLIRGQSTPNVRTSLNGIDVTLKQGSMEDMFCDAAMVVIQEDYVHAKGMSSRLFRKGGKGVQTAMDKVRASSTNLFPGSSFTTEAGENRCKLLVHCVESPENEELLFDALFDGLKDAHKCKCIKINIPVQATAAIALQQQIIKLCKVISDFAEKYGKFTTVKCITLVADNNSQMQIAMAGFQRSFECAVSQMPTSRDNPAMASVSSSVRAKHSFGSQAPITQPTSPSSANLRNGITIHLVTGEIAKSKRDVVVNSTSPDLVLTNGAVSSSILKAAGSSIQAECEQELSKQHIHKIQYGDVVPTSAGNLRSKKIYHGALQNYSSTNEVATEELNLFVGKCLQLAADENLESIAFPSLGTGQLGFPRDLVAENMLHCIEKFDSKTLNSSIKTVDIVVYSQDASTVMAFEKEFASFKQTLSDGNEDYVMTPVASHVPAFQPSLPPSSKSMNDGQGGDNVSFQKIKIEIVKGDITSETSDAIVYSTDNDFSFGSQIGTIIKQKAGPELQEELKTTEMRKGVAITGAGALKCKHIIHVDAPDDSNEWKRRIIGALKLAEKNNLASISFPALGTGIKQVTVGSIAVQMAEGIEEFSSNSKSLQKIRLVIFEDSMLGRFQQEFGRIASHPSKQTKGWGFISAFKKVYSYLSDSPTQKAEILTSSVDPTKSGGNADGASSEDKSLTGYRHIVLQIFAFDKGAIKMTKQRLDRECDKISKTITIRDECEDIAKLTKDQIQSIQQLEEVYDAEIVIHKTDRVKDNYIKIRSTMEFQAKINKIIQNIYRTSEKEEEKKLLYEKVKWQSLTKDGFEDYPVGINYDIEQAYKKDEDSFWYDSDNGPIEIDFYNMVERHISVAGSAKKIRRYAPDSVELPRNWTKMSPGQQHVEVLISPQDDSTKVEYETEFRNFKMALELQSDSRISKNKSLENIVEIRRIQNPSLFKKYVMHKNHMSQPKERNLWHGTKPDIVQTINANGFNRSYAGTSVGTLYGKGVYFSKYAGYSHNYSPPDSNGIRWMYLCSVLTGEHTLGKGDLIEPPPKDAQNPVIKYDSVTDDMNDPSMWVVFTDTQAYPNYLIKYKGT